MTLVVVTGTASLVTTGVHLLLPGKASPLPHFTSGSSPATVPPPASLFKQQNQFEAGASLGEVYLTVAFLHDSRTWSWLYYINTMFSVTSQCEEGTKQEKQDVTLGYQIQLLVRLPSGSRVSSCVHCLFVLKYCQWVTCCVCCGEGAMVFHIPSLPL